MRRRARRRARRLHRRPGPRRRRSSPQHRPARAGRARRSAPAAQWSSTNRCATGLPHVFAAGDGVVTHHRLLGVTYLPLGTTAHKQGRVAGENALGGQPGSPAVLGTQVVKVFDLVAARTGLRDHEAVAAGYTAAAPRRRRGRPQALLPRRPADQHPHHRRHRLRPAARRPTGRPTRHRDRQTRRHLCDRAVRRTDRRPGQRSRPLLHPTARISVGCRSSRDRPGPASTRPSALPHDHPADRAVHLPAQRGPVATRTPLLGVVAPDRFTAKSAGVSPADEINPVVAEPSGTGHRHVGGAAAPDHLRIWRPRMSWWR